VNEMTDYRKDSWINELLNRSRLICCFCIKLLYFYDKKLFWIVVFWKNILTRKAKQRTLTFIKLTLNSTPCYLIKHKILFVTLKNVFSFHPKFYKNFNSKRQITIRGK
jgi:hypothetical protein